MKNNNQIWMTKSCFATLTFSSATFPDRKSLKIERRRVFFFFKIGKGEKKLFHSQEGILFKGDFISVECLCAKRSVERASLAERKRWNGGRKRKRGEVTAKGQVKFCCSAVLKISALKRALAWKAIWLCNVCSFVSLWI